MADNNEGKNNKRSALKQTALDKAIKKALTFKLEDCRRRETQENDLDAMVLTCQEFMKTFIILGYDMDGDAIPPIIVANNQQEADSLNCYLNKLIHNNVRNLNIDEDNTD